MGYARQAALVVFSLAAEFNSAYVIKQVSLVNSTLLPVGYTFIDQVNGENKTLSEVSACRFIDDERAVLVGDSGELFKARIVLQDAHLLNVTIESIWSQLKLTIPGFAGAPDSEGCELIGDAFLVSLEDPLSVMRFNLTTGQRMDAPPSFEVPTNVSSRFITNKGFEALTAFDRQSWLLTTTEQHLLGDPSGKHRLLIWNATQGGLPVFEQTYFASSWSSAGNKKLAVNEFERVPSETEAILSLERIYDSEIGTMIRLFEVDLSYREARKHLLMEWSGSNLRSVPDGTSYDLPVDNYEGMCLFPNSTKLLLVNDDNQNPDQIGTQFVVLDLVLYDDNLSPLDESYRESNGERSTSSPDSKNSKSKQCHSQRASMVLALLIILLALLVSAGCIFGFYRLQKSRSHRAFGRAKADFAPLGELDLDDVVTKIELKTLHGDDSRSNRMDEIIL